MQSVDRPKVAELLHEEIERCGRKPSLYIQVNTGEEPQKAGVAPHEAPRFIERCRDELKLPIVGLMCIPPADEAPAPHFALFRKIAEANRLDQLSMGMSPDFQ